MKIKLAAASALLLASTVAGSAADLAVKARPYVPPAPIFTWTGFYIGGHVGAGWGTTETSLTSITANGQFQDLLGIALAQNSTSGFLGGVQVGYNWQSGIAVFGIQGDFAGADIKGTTPCNNLGEQGGTFLSCTSKSNWLATASGRLGAVIAERGLIYVKGGAAWLNTKHSIDFIDDEFGRGQLAGGEKTNWGWLLGMGLEYSFAPNWSAFIEYNYMEFDRKNVGLAVNPVAFGGEGRVQNAFINADIQNKLSIAKIGVNYNFNYGAPVVAKY